MNSERVSTEVLKIKLSMINLLFKIVPRIINYIPLRYKIFLNYLCGAIKLVNLILPFNLLYIKKMSDYFFKAYY